jgi:DNA-binding MarR family transcriptional regulator
MAALHSADAGSPAGDPVTVAVDCAAEALVAAFDAAREGARTRLSNSQLQALLVVERQEGLNLRALADELGAMLSSASRLCDRLVAAGMIERMAGQVDRREIALVLTGAGRRVLEQLRADRRDRLEEILARMSAAGRAALLRGLREFELAARAEDLATRADSGAARTDGATRRSA